MGSVVSFHVHFELNGEFIYKKISGPSFSDGLLANDGKEEVAFRGVIEHINETMMMLGPYRAGKSRFLSSFTNHDFPNDHSVVGVTKDPVVQAGVILETKSLIIDTPGFTESRVVISNSKGGLREISGASHKKSYYDGLIKFFTPNWIMLGFKEGCDFDSYMIESLVYLNKACKNHTKIHDTREFRVSIVIFCSSDDDAEVIFSKYCAEPTIKEFLHLGSVVQENKTQTNKISGVSSHSVTRLNIPPHIWFYDPKTRSMIISGRYKVMTGKVSVFKKAWYAYRKSIRKTR